MSAKGRDAGFSLVELAVYVVILGLISSIVAAVIVSLFRSEQTVSGITQASNTSQVVTQALTRDLRNARSFSTSGNTLTASVASAASPVTWECVQWAVDSNGDLRRKTKSNGASTWGTGGVIASKVSAVGTTAYFAGGTSGTSAGTSTGTLTYSFKLPTTSSSSAEVSGQISNRSASTGANC